ncbi:MAG: hypothetical protein V4638_01445 [Bacteroidota bacterium]
MTFKRSLIYSLLVLAVVSCSTEKNTFINRSFHGVTAHYNGYFNANELINQSLTAYRASLKEDYYEALPIEPLPDEKQVIGLYPSLDTAVSKCSKVISKHAMPSNDKPSQKKAEHNNWIDENWITIGVAQYYRRDYEASLKNFNFVKKFFGNDPSLYWAELWKAKTNLEINNLTEAGFNIAVIDKALEAYGTTNKNRKIKPKKGEKESLEVPVPKKLLFEFHKTKALFFLKKENKEESIKYLKSALEFAKKQPDKARLNYVIAQMYESLGNNSSAKEHYSKVLKYNTKYEMTFNARLKRAFMGGDEKVEKELQKMLKDAKNAEFKDQIYYALADIKFQNGDVATTKEYLTKSAFYSNSNTRQKGMAYERLGNISYSERNYVAAQKYYDSCAKVIAETYPNYEGVKNKAEKLADLVVAVEREFFEDSVQRIAQMSEEERVKFIEKVIKQKQEEERRRKEEEARRLRELQEQANNTNTNTNGKWYFDNEKTRQQGNEEFKKLWGTRENLDDWRRSDKTTLIVIPDEDDTTTVVQDVTPSDDPDSLTMEMLLVDIPLTDSAMKVSTDRLLEAMYNSGVIYKEQLNELELAKKQFSKVIAKEVTHPTDLASSYQMYKIYEGNDLSEPHKTHILTYYPNSDYANYLRDPEFFVKRKEIEALAVQEYVTVLDRYGRGLYYPVMAKADLVIANEKENPYRSKYMLLKAMCLGQISSDKEPMKPILETVLVEYPKTPEATRAQEMLDIIKNGYSKNEEVNFDKTSVFKFNDELPQWVVIFLEKDDNVNLSKTKVSDFNKEFFSRDKLKTSSKIYGADQSVVLVQEFETDLKALEYLRVYKQTKKHLMDLAKAKILIITQENMKILFEKQNLSEYELFHEDNY